MFQEASLDLKLTARENLRLGAALYDVPRALAARRIDEALALMALGDRADEPASKYSGGMRRRIEIARVLLHEPSLLLLDEPGRGVDPEALRRIWDEIAALAAARGDQRHRDHAPARRGGALPPHRDPGRRPRRGAPARPTSCARTSPATSCACAATQPDELRATITARLGLAGRVVDGDVVVEAPRGHEVVPRIAELFPPGGCAAIATSRPTLADVFAKLTGKGLSS